METHEPQQSSAKTATRVVAGVVRRHGKILICQRSRTGPHPLRWEFPGGKIEPGETEVEALVRELGEELALVVRPEEVGRLLTRFEYQYPRSGSFELAFYEIADCTGEATNRIFEAIRWEAPEALSSYDFLEADRPLLPLLANL